LSAGGAAKLGVGTWAIVTKREKTGRKRRNMMLFEIDFSHTNDTTRTSFKVTELPIILERIP
jgi:hypothetical protein